MTKSITIKLLKKHKAYKYQVDKFKEIFGEEFVPTRELCLLHAQNFDFKWARGLLDERGRKFFDEAKITACKVLDEDDTTALKVLVEEDTTARTTAQKVLDEDIVLALKAFNEAITTARKVFNEAFVTAMKVFDETIALAWFDAWESQT